jgi:precorrin-6B methylase 2
MDFLITIVAALFGVTLLLIVIYFLGRPIVHGAIYFPTSPRGVERMVALAGIKVGQRIVDLGSGDGRILIACAQQGAEAIGYEINPMLVWRSRRAIKRAGVGSGDPVGARSQGRATVYWESFWRIDLSQFDVVFVYGIPYIMRDLQRKLERELRPGTRVVSNAFRFPGWKPVAEEGKTLLYVKK